MTSVASKWLRGLNPEQAEVVSTIEGPLVVMAGAGSGKTASLIRRTGHIAEVTRNPQKILCVTFSKKAAGEMKKRAISLGIDISDSGVNFSTWHAFCYHLIRASKLPFAQWNLDSGGGFYKRVIKDALGYKHLGWDSADEVEIEDFISIAKAYALSPRDKELEPIIRRFTNIDWQIERYRSAYEIAERLREEMQFVTFDDLLKETLHLFHKNDKAKEYIQSRYDYILQDEVQDSSQVQNLLADVIQHKHKNYMVVGDPSQTIFSFRGSEPRFLLGFQETYQAKLITMNRNYRSGSRIIDVANKVLEGTSYKLPLDLVPECKHEGEVHVRPFLNSDHAAQDLVKDIQARTKLGGSFRDFAVIYRTNSQSRAFEDALMEAQIPFTVAGGFCFYDRREIRDLLAYFRIAFDKDRTGDAIKHCLNSPNRFLGNKFQEHVRDVRGQYKGSWPQVVRAATGASGIQGRQRTAAEDWAKIVESLQISPLPPAALLRTLVQRLDYLTWVDKRADRDKDNLPSQNVEELIKAAEPYKSVQGYLDRIDFMIELTKKAEKDEDKDAVRLMSIHKGKGLEFERVWLVGCNDGVMPHAKAKESEFEEERRLFYVAVTRAKQELTIAWYKSPDKRTHRIGTPSRFIEWAGLMPPTDSDRADASAEIAEVFETSAQP